MVQIKFVLQMCAHKVDIVAIYAQEKRPRYFLPAATYQIDSGTRQNCMRIRM